MNTFEHQSTAVAMPAGAVTLHGQLDLPSHPGGLVLFALGGGGGRSSPRHQRVAGSLHHLGIATLAFDLVPESREPTDGFAARLRNNTELQAERLKLARAWVRRQERLAELPIGYFGANDGAAVVLLAAAEEDADVQAVVTRGGRPDLPVATIQKVRAPTLLIVGGNDELAASINLEMWARLRCEKAIEIIPGATHRFEEPGALDNLAELTARWFGGHLPRNAHLAA